MRSADGDGVDGTPYLLSLGLTKSKTSAVWVAGPLSGIIVQPIVGAIADRSTSRWGRRRPFMMGGSIFVSVCLLVLAWAAEIVALFNKDHDSVRKSAVQVAITAHGIVAGRLLGYRGCRCHDICCRFLHQCRSVTQNPQAPRS